VGVGRSAIATGNARATRFPIASGKPTPKLGIVGFMPSEGLTILDQSERLYLLAQSEKVGGLGKFLDIEMAG
jgi:hypothetical protein